MPARVNIPFSEQLRRLPPAVRGIVQAARRTVKTIAPQGKEVFYKSQPPGSRSAMWKLARYVVDGGDGYVVGIGSFADHASLFFPRGRELDDGSGVLEGTGKRFRFITLRAPADMKRAEVKAILRGAFRLPSPK